MHRIIPVLLLLLLPAAASGQHAVVEGTVHTPNGSAAPNVSVSFLHPHASVRTDSVGSFRTMLPMPAERGQVLILAAGNAESFAGPCRAGVVAGDTLKVELVLQPRDSLRRTAAHPIFEAPFCTASLRRSRPAQIDTLRAQGTFDPIAEAAGLPPLRTLPRRPGYRELRISDGGGMLWEPRTTVRIVDHGGEVSGGEYVWYPEKEREYWGHRGFSPERIAPGCRMMQGALLCERRLVDADVEGLVAAFDSLEVWTLPSQTALGVYFNHGFDQQDVTVELLDGVHYGAINYYHPKGEPYGERVLVMLRLVQAITHTP